MADPGLGLPHARIASGDSFVACPDAAADLAALGATLVDMEVGAVAQVAARLGKPWAAIKAVTDEANGASAGDFHANLVRAARAAARSEEHTSELQSLMRISYAVFCLKKKTNNTKKQLYTHTAHTTETEH